MDDAPLETKKCAYCEGEISASAKACKHCGRTTPAQKSEGLQRGCFIVILIGAALVGLIFWGNSLPDQTPARDPVEQRCLDTRGDGNWTPDLGPSLEDFCRAAGNLNRLRRP